MQEGGVKEFLFQTQLTMDWTTTTPIVCRETGDMSLEIKRLARDERFIHEMQFGTYAKVFYEFIPQLVLIGLQGGREEGDVVRGFCL